MNTYTRVLHKSALRIMIIIVVGCTCLSPVANNCYAQTDIIINNDEYNQNLCELLTKVYPQQWSGKIVWYYSPERDVVKDLHNGLKNHEIILFDSQAMKYIIGKLDFDGTKNVVQVYDGQLHVIFNLSGVPNVFPPGYNALGRESTALVYGFLENPQNYKVTLNDNVYVIHNLSGFTVYIDAQTGYVIKTEFMDAAWIYSDYTIIDDCPWATKCISGMAKDVEAFENNTYKPDEKSENSVGVGVAYNIIESRKWETDTFQYTKYYKDKTHDTDEVPIVYLEGNQITEEKARAFDCPLSPSPQQWDSYVRNILGDNPPKPPPPTPDISSKNVQKLFRFSYGTLTWIGIVLILTGIACKIKYSYSKVH